MDNAILTLRTSDPSFLEVVQFVVLVNIVLRSVGVNVDKLSVNINTKSLFDEGTNQDDKHLQTFNDTPGFKSFKNSLF